MTETSQSAETKLPTIENFESGELTLRGILNAHEQHYKEDLKEDAKQFEQNIDIKHTDREMFDLGRKTGRLEAVQSLRGKK